MTRARSTACFEEAVMRNTWAELAATGCLITAMAWTPIARAESRPEAPSAVGALKQTAPASVAQRQAAPIVTTADWHEPAALVAAGVGVVGLVLGTMLVLDAKSKNDDSAPFCPPSIDRCTPAGASLRDDARSAGDLATAFYAVGVVSLGASAVLWLTSPRPDTPKNVAALRVSATFGGVTMLGRW